MPAQSRVISQIRKSAVRFLPIAHLGHSNRSCYLLTTDRYGPIITVGGVGGVGDDFSHTPHEDHETAVVP